MGKKKTVLERNGNAKNGKPWRNRHIDATPLDQEADGKIVEKTSTTMWLFGLVVVSLLSLITRLHNLQQPASVWLVFFLEYCRCYCAVSADKKGCYRRYYLPVEAHSNLQPA